MFKTFSSSVFFLGHANIMGMLLFIIVQTLWECYFGMFSEQVATFKKPLDEHPTKTFQRKYFLNDV